MIFSLPVKYWFTCSFVLLSTGLFLSTAHAQSVETLGKQSVLEQYDAPIRQAESAEPLVIDFNRLLEASTENDGIEVADSLNKLIISFSTQEHKYRGQSDKFVVFTSNSRIPEQGDALLQSIRNGLAGYQSKPITFGDLRGIKQVIIDAYEKIGYPLMSVVIPPQEIIYGELQITIHEFRLGKMNYQWRQEDGSYSNEGENWTSLKNLDKTFSSLKELPVLSKDHLSDPVAYMNANPYRKVKVVFEPGDNVDETNVNVLIDEQRPWDLSASYNNHATESSGTNRYSFGATLGNTPFEDDQLALQATYGDNRNEFETYSVVYTTPLRNGHSVTINGSYSDTASSTIPGISSASTTYSLIGNYDVPLYKEGEYELTSTHAISFRRFERYSFFGGAPVGDAAFESVEVSTGGSFSWKDSYAAHKLDATLTASLTGITPDNTDRDSQLFHGNAEEADYFFSVINYARQQDLSAFGLQGFNTSTQVSWQQASRITAGADNFSIGGPSVLKAYESGEISGDEGWYIIQDISYPAFQPDSNFINQLQVSNFIEIGRAWGINSPGTKLWDYGLSLSSVIRDDANCSASLAWAGTQGVTTDDSDSRFFLSCGYQY